MSNEDVCCARGKKGSGSEGPIRVAGTRRVFVHSPPKERLHDIQMNHRIKESTQVADFAENIHNYGIEAIGAVWGMHNPDNVNNI